MTQTIKIRNEPAQHIGVANSAPCPEMNIVEKEITENGRYEARTEGVTGFDPVIVNVPSREEIGYENGYNDGYGKGRTDGYADALAKRTELEVTANGEYIPEGESTGFSKVSVNLPSDTAVIDGLIDGTLSGAYRNDRVTKVKGYGFYNQPITSIELPNVTKFSGGYAFYNCSKMTTASLPKISFLNIYSFMGCAFLYRVYIPSATTISANTFDGCSRLTTVILGGTNVCKLSSTTAFNGCNHILGTSGAGNSEGLKDGFIYVPKILLEDYRQATNWATYADQFRAIEDYPEITGG